MMCEPYHSIIQYPDQPDDDDRLGGGEDGGGLRIKMLLGKMTAWGKKIGKFFNYSALGNGHSEALNKLSSYGAMMAYSMRLTNYEVGWWNRSVKFDGSFYGPPEDKELGLLSATEYAQKTSIGNLHLLRQFLEVSMQKSIRPIVYVDQFRNLLTEKGRREYDLSIRRLGISLYSFMEPPKDQLDKLIKTTLGYTRKRGLLVPEWADDDSLGWRGTS
jgi:hypothetical protein